MQTTFQTARPSLGAFKSSSAPAARRPTVVVRAHSNVDFIKEMGKNAAVIAAGLVLTMAPAAEAKIANKATKFEKNQAYQAELLNNLKARTGKDTAVYGSLTERPADVTPPAYQRPPLKFDGGIGSSKIETPSSVPKPAPAKPATVAPPKSKASAAPAAPAAVDNSASIDISSYLNP